MTSFAASIRRPDLLDDECEVCGWSIGLGFCGCNTPASAGRRQECPACNGTGSDLANPYSAGDIESARIEGMFPACERCDGSGEAGPTLAEVGGRERYDSYCGHRAGSCSCAADDDAFFADETP